LFHGATRHETIFRRDETISRFGANVRKRRLVINCTTKTAGSAGSQTGDSQMRTLSFILAFAFILAGPSMTGSSDKGLPGIGTFAYNGSPAVAAPQPLVIAAR
jgi:hypothetical protein